MKTLPSPCVRLFKHIRLSVLVGALGLAWTQAFAQPAKGIESVAETSSPESARESAYDDSAVIGQPMSLVVGKSTLLRLPQPADRISVGNPTIADVTAISSRELYLLGKVFGSTNLILWRKGGVTTVIDIAVNPDTGLLKERLHTLLPEEKGIEVSAASDSVVLSGTVSSAVKAGQAVEIAEAFVANLNRGLTAPIIAGDQAVAPGTRNQMDQTRNAASSARVVNLMTTAAPQQVMLEVKVAEVQKTLLDKLGGQVFSSNTNGSWTYRLLTDFLTNSPGILDASKTLGGRSFTLDAAKKDGLIKVLAEPNIVAISGQQASFLAGGKIFIPVAITPNTVTGVTHVTLEEKEFGVGLKFTPTVLDGDRINLSVSPEVSELSQTGSPFATINNITTVMPSMTVRRVQTTVQLNDGQSLAIAGLIKSNVTETVNRFPFLGEIPILGALFRSSEFQSDQTELMFIITPRLVKPLAANYKLPTDNFVPPSRSEFFLGGKMEGSAPESSQETKREEKPEPPEGAETQSSASSATQPAADKSVVEGK